MGVGGIIFFWLTPGRAPPVRFLSALIVRLHKELVGKWGTELSWGESKVSNIGIPPGLLSCIWF